MGTKLWNNGWVRQIAVFVSYVLVHSAIPPFTDSHLALYAGQRLGWLLLSPYRYWPTLIVADVVCLAETAIPTASVFGTTWALLDLIPGVGLAAPIVWWCRERLALFPTKRLINFRVLLICTLLVTSIWSTIVFLTVLTAKLPPGHYIEHPALWILPDLFLGQYVGVLATVPCALMIKIELQSELPFLQRLQEIKKRLVATDTLILLLCAPIFLFWLSHRNHNDPRHVSLMVVFLPIVWLMLKPGWRSAALGGTVAILCICLLIDSHPMRVALRTNAFIAVTITCLYALGMRSASRRQEEEQDRLAAEQAIHLARQSIHLHETRLRKTAHALELAGSALHHAQHQLLARFQNLLPANEAQRYYRQAVATHKEVHRIADAMHPSAWRERGLPAALRETLARALGEAGIHYDCEIGGRGLSDLASGVHTAIYRLACESIVYVNTQMICSRVRLTLRGGITNHTHWAVLRIEGRLELSRINDAVYDISERDQLASKLGTHSLGREALRNHAQLFHGELHERVGPKGVRLTYLLIDTSKQGQQSGNNPAAANPWIS
jgi:two-component system, NarL family, sensor histidine kinase FusK